MKREFLRGLGIDEEHIPKIIDEHHDSLKEYKDSANKLTEIESQLQTANEELSNRDKQINDLKASTEGHDDLQKQIDDYKATNEQYEEKLKDVNRKNALKLKAVESGARNPDAVVKLFDMDALEYDDKGNPTNLDDKFKEFQEAEDYLFTPKGKTGRTPSDGKSTPPMTKEQIMGIKDSSERIKAIQENSQLFN